MRLRFPVELSEPLDFAIRSWDERDGTRRLLERDASLWTGGEESRWLGWLGAPERAVGELGRWQEIAADARAFEHALLLGMGGSSLCAEVQASILGPTDGHPEMRILDSTSPDQIRATERGIDLARTLFVVSSKSGSTLEPNLLLDYFLAKVTGVVGGEKAGRSFLAVTDPGSILERRARATGFRRVVHGEPSIGGRFSALSAFGLVPAAVQGIDLGAWLDAARRMSERCRAGEPATNPGVGLGLALGVAAQAGRDKLTLVAAPRLAPLGAWIEQLVAESTGKRGMGILPFDGERLAHPGVYGSDRVFVALRDEGALGEGDDERLATLAAAGHPVIDLELGDLHEIAAEFYRWEIATAVAGALLGLDPFDQPDVEAAKVEARRLTRELEETGTLPQGEPILEARGVRLYAERAQARVLRAAAGPNPGLEDLLRAHLARLGPGDYFGLLAFVARDAERIAPLERIRHGVRDARRVASALGFGPRFLHSTGQAYKGGPASGVFVQVTSAAEYDLEIPTSRASFGQVLLAQAGGDLAVLEARGRRCLRIDLEDGSPSALGTLADAVERALGEEAK